MYWRHEQRRVRRMLGVPRLPSGQLGALILLLVALAVSLLGTMMSFVAVPWFVMGITGDPSKVSLSAFFAMLPAVAGGLLGGALTDRFGAKLISVVSDLACCIAFASIF